MADLDDSVGGDRGAADAVPANRSQLDPGLTAISMADPVGFELLFGPSDPAASAKEPSVLAGIEHSSIHFGTAQSRTVVGFLWGQEAY